MKRILLAMLMALACGEGNAQSTRLISASRKIHDGTIMQAADTAIFTYRPGNNNSHTVNDYTNSTPKCDTSTVYRYTNGKRENDTRHISYFNATGLADSIIQQNGAGAVWDNFRRYVHTYDAGGNVTGTKTYGWRKTLGTWFRISEQVNEYAGGNLVKTAVYTGFGDTTISTYAYSKGNLQSVVQQSNMGGMLQPYNQTRYTYDTDNNNDSVVTGMWNGSGFTDNVLQAKTYKGKQMASLETLSWDNFGGNWMKLNYLALMYNTAGQCTTDTSFNWNADSTAYLRNFARSYTYNAAGMNDTIYNSEWISWTGEYMHTKRIAMEYNGDNQQTRRLTSSWDGTKWDEMIYDMDDRYYYQPVYPTAIGAVQQGGAVLRLYPNPANDILTIDIHTTDAQPCIVRIYNTMGALLQQWEEKAGSATRSIATQQLQNGMYILSISSNGTNTTAQFIISH